MHGWPTPHLMTDLAYWSKLVLQIDISVAGLTWEGGCRLASTGAKS
jgi:hypothetical protein